MERNDRRLEAAVALGIITEQQAQAIRAIAPAHGERAPRPPRAIDAATIGYVLGAITVVAAMGWFLADRWEWLGPGGALATAVLYGVILVVVSQRLAREGFTTASGLAMLLAVGTVPVATIALNELLGLFARVPFDGCHTSDFDLLACRGEELLVELVTIAAALLALRRARFAPLVLPVAALSLRLLFHLVDALGASPMGYGTQGWVWAIGASFTAAAAYTAERRQSDDLDIAFWLHFVSVVAALTATLQVVGSEEFYKHLLPAGAVVAFAYALLMRRFVHVVLGMLWFTGYVFWLAASVFRDSPAFPIVLAALGIAVIVATVWVQRNAERLAARVGVVGGTGRPRLPGGAALLLAPALVAALMIPMAVREDADRNADARWSGERFARRTRAEAIRTAREEEARAAAAKDAKETPPPPQP
ncbi:MAG: hypothetical protein KA761_10080 [Gemmatimonadaceae bacterium]|jgi:hypothetical protein|nr:hypothetical protein [Gemmatimonadaceae bacterium]